MKEILVISGKGGAGKTSIAASFAAVADNAVIVDCDVDAADMHLLLKTELKENSDFYSGSMPVVTDKCIGCGKCQQLCRFDAIEIKNDIAIVNEHKCEGCGVCADNCPVSAIDMEDALTGQLMVSQTEYGQMVHAKLGAGGENSGKLVAEVRKKAAEIAKQTGADFIVSDGPPGIGCPVIASLGGVDKVLIVTEATISGFHDMQRVHKLCNHFKIECDICINKSDINEEVTSEIRKFAEENGLNCLAEIPYNKVFYKAQLETKPVVLYSESGVSDVVENMWKELVK